MDLHYFVGLIFLFIGESLSFYSGSNVVELNPSNFKSKVLDSDELWLVEFYAPWCGHCQRLTPDWKKAADELQGVVNVGAVDADQHGSLGGQYGVQGFPTIKIFGANKNRPKDYNGPRQADGIVDQAFKELRQMVKDKKSGGGSGGSSSHDDDDRDSGKNEVITLTDDNFQELVINSKESWLVEFYAPWCGHCKRLEPEWKAAAAEVKDKTGGAVKLGALDATANQAIASRYGIRGYPTIKIFKQGFKDDQPEDYEGGRDRSGIVAKAMDLYTENIEPPTVDEILNQEMVDETCKNNQLCIIAFLPHILDSKKEGRNEALDLLRSIGETFKKQKWGWMWAEGGKQFDLEKAVKVGGSGYPALVAVNVRKEMYTLFNAAFSKDGLKSFFNGLSFGKAGKQTYDLIEGKLPKIAEAEPWNGEDGELPDEGDDYDLSDFSWDDDEPEQKDEL